MASRRSLTLLLAVVLPGRAWCTATLEVAGLPTAVIADGVTSTAVLCRITNGYPSNIYAVKGTFSRGDLPYYGLTYNAARTAWVPQIGSWDVQQPRIVTDAGGRWEGWILVRLETAGPRGDAFFRFSAVPLEPVSNPGPTVSPWAPVRCLDGTPSGGAGWVRGHAYLDKACTQPADGVVVRVWNGEGYTGDLVGAWLSQNTRLPDGEDHTDAGLFRLGVPVGVIRSIGARDRLTNAFLPVYTRVAPPWTVRAGETTSVDRAWGDVDGNGILTVADAVAACRIAAGIAPASRQDGQAADVWPGPADGAVTLGDVVSLMRQAAR